MELRCDKAVIMVAAHCFFSHVVSGEWSLGHILTRGISMGGEYDELGGASGADGGDTGLVAIIGVSFLSWGIGSPPKKS
jgi:hypothetical protein